MFKYIVTGAGGHIGNTLIRTLLEKNLPCLAVVHSKTNSALENLSVSTAAGDICDANFLRSIIEPGDKVLHCAGRIEITGGKRKEVYAANLDGTRAVLRACEEADSRLIYVSSVDVFEKPPEGKIQEPMNLVPDAMKSNYARSKCIATLEVLGSARTGRCDASVVYPSAVIGPNDYNVSNVGQVIDDFRKGLPMARIKGGYNFVDVRDIADGIIACADHGATGRDYLLTGEYCSVDHLFEILSPICGRAVPPKLPLGLIKTFAELGVLYYRVRGKKPVFSRYALKTLNSNCDYDCSRAEKELGFSHRGCVQSIADSAKWFAER